LHLLWHNFVRVREIWIKFCNLSVDMNYKRQVKFWLRTLSHWGKIFRKPQKITIFWLTLYMYTHRAWKRSTTFLPLNFAKCLFALTLPSVLCHCWLGGRKGIRHVQNGGWWRWALVSPDGVAPSWMVDVSASVNLPLDHKVQKFSSGSGTGSHGWSRKKGHKTLVCVCVILPNGDRFSQFFQHQT